MAKWNLTCNKFKEVRELINNDGDYREILRKLHEICADYCFKNWIFADDFEDLGMEIWEVVDSEDEVDMETVDYYLSEFYDLCDNARVWLAL